MHLPPIGRIYSWNGPYLLATHFYTNAHLSALRSQHSPRHPNLTVVRYTTVKRKP